MSKFTYFAFGSNMLTERLRHHDRCPSAIPIGVAAATGYRIAYCKRSTRDRSGKATLCGAIHEDEMVYGVLFEIAVDERDALDRAEGAGFGYDRHRDFEVRIIENQSSLKATTYLASADAMEHGLVPFDWYHALVLAGARQHKLPPDYVARIGQFASTSDPQPSRKETLEALKILRTAGFEEMADNISKAD